MALMEDTHYDDQSIFEEIEELFDISRNELIDILILKNLSLLENLMTS